MVKPAWSLNTLPDLSAAEIGIWLELLEFRTGISFEKYQRILQAGLKQRMREIDCDNFAEYYQLVTEGKQAAAEWSALLRTLTVKETRFYRDETALAFLQDYLYQSLPRQDENEPLEVWSVACSTGEEPYSLAMLIKTTLNSLGINRFFGITATDICLSSLAVARKGAYNNRRLQSLPKRLSSQFFKGIDANNSQVVEELKEHICFAQANIIKLEHLPVNNIDIIYCQNVLIYFKRWRQKVVLDELVERLKPRGVLVIGMGEAVDWNNNKVERIKDDRVQAYIKVA